MIVRILGEGQWEIEKSQIGNLNSLDDAVDGAVDAQDQERLTAALGELLDEIRSLGQALPDDDLRDSDLILPALDSTVDEVRALLDPAGEGLLPGSRSPPLAKRRRVVRRSAPHVVLTF